MTSQQLKADLSQYIEPYLSRAEQPQALEQKPDIIVIQCESFFDFTTDLGAENFSEDPLPFFHQLQQRAASGLVYSPVYGLSLIHILQAKPSAELKPAKTQNALFAEKVGHQQQAGDCLANAGSDSCAHQPHL